MVYPEKEYALYKGDELLGMGTAHELADLLNVKVETIHFYSTPTYQKRTNPDKARRLIPLDDEETE
ncbi:hypothetical protein [Streptococcus suis]|uniref:hypothetical protein n=1 Tax=Streptococcus suis TaxID=1307 RepID=UPI000943C073|nr:hypothetical protein [Streptococcus suis]